jgi:hypothetical protein
MMKRKLFWWGLSGGLVSAAVLAGAIAVAQAPGPQPPGGQPAPAAVDIRKDFIEIPTKKLVARSDAAPGDANPRVEAGKVRWHADFETACQAAAKSNKPVLVFHMMGRLDERFC